MKVEIKPEETALLVVDMQNYLVKEEMKGLVDMVKEDKVIENVSEVVKAARKAGITIVHVKHVSPPDVEPAVTDYSLKGLSHDGKPMKERIPPTEFGLEIIDELTPEKGEYTISKGKGNAFYNTNLKSILHNNFLIVKTIILTGVITNGCIDATVRGARERDFNVIIPIDCTATRERVDQEHWIKNVFPKSAVTMTTEETIETLRLGYFFSELINRSE